MSRDQNAGRSRYIKTDSSSFERGEQLKYLGTILTYQNSIQNEIKSRLMSGNACYYSIHNLLSSSFLSKNIMIKIYRTIIFLLFFMGVKLGHSHWGRNVGWGCLRIGFWGVGPKRDEVIGEWRRLLNEELNDLYSSPNIWMIKSRRMNWAGHVARVRKRRDAWRVLVGKRDGRPRRRWENNMKMDIQEEGWVSWTRLFWLRIGTAGGHL